MIVKKTRKTPWQASFVRFMRDNGLTLAEVARRLGVAWFTVQRWTNTPRRPRDLAAFRRYVASFRGDASWVTSSRGLAHDPRRRLPRKG